MTVLAAAIGRQSKAPAQELSKSQKRAAFAKATGKNGVGALGIAVSDQNPRMNWFGNGPSNAGRDNEKRTKDERDEKKGNGTAPQEEPINKRVNMWSRFPLGLEGVDTSMMHIGP